MLDQRRRRWADVVQMLYKCFVFSGLRTSGDPIYKIRWLGIDLMPGRHLNIRPDIEPTFGQRIILDISVQLSEIPGAIGFPKSHVMPLINFTFLLGLRVL